MDLEQKDMLWIGLGALLSVLLVLVGYDQLSNLHFRAWELYEGTESSETLAQAVRPAFTGWYRPLVLVLGLVAGLVGTYRAIRGQWRPLVAQLTLLVFVLAAIELTQQYGQRATPTSQVDVVPTSSLVWAAALGVVPLAALVVGAVRLRTTDR